MTPVAVPQLWASVYAAEYSRMVARFNVAPRVHREGGVSDALVGCIYDGEACHTRAVEAADQAVETFYNVFGEES